MNRITPSWNAASPPPGRNRGALAVGCAVALALGGGVAFFWFGRDQTPPPAPAPAPPPAARTNGAALPPPPPAPAFRQVRFPTDQANLLDGGPDVLQPTASGNPESAGYGSVRTTNRGRRLAASFHEGVDIAPTHRDRRGRPLDSVYAIADGRVAHVNRVVGNSNYGLYVVLLHADPVGEVYTLYAHLSVVTPGLAAGAPVKGGAVLGTMGNTPADIIPMARAHTHFEVGLVNNDRFGAWFRAQRLKPDHGNYNGWNLLALDPLAFFRAQRADPTFEFGNLVRQTPVAFEVVVACPHPLDYFRRYPSLWHGVACTGNGMVLGSTGNGVVLSGRNATPEEAARIGRQKAAVLSVNEAVLGRNGAHLVVRDRNGWRLGEGGARWLQILTY